MKNNLFRVLGALVGLKLLSVIFCGILVVITIYQLIISLFIPSFLNVLIILVEFGILIALIFWTIFC